MSTKSQTNINFVVTKGIMIACKDLLRTAPITYIISCVGLNDECQTISEDEDI